MANLLAVYPCENGDRLEIRGSAWNVHTLYMLYSKRLDNRQSISEYEARTIMHDEGFLFCAISLPLATPTTASGELTVP